MDLFVQSKKTSSFDSKSLSVYFPNGTRSRFRCRLDECPYHPNGTTKTETIIGNRFRKYQNTSSFGYTIPDGHTPIIPILIGEPDDTVRFQKALDEQAHIYSSLFAHQQFLNIRAVFDVRLQKNLYRRTDIFTRLSIRLKRKASKKRSFKSAFIKSKKKYVKN